MIDRLGPRTGGTASFAATDRCGSFEGRCARGPTQTY